MKFKGTWLESRQEEILCHRSHVLSYRPLLLLSLVAYRVHSTELWPRSCRSKRSKFQVHSKGYCHLQYFSPWAVLITKTDVAEHGLQVRAETKERVAQKSRSLLGLQMTQGNTQIISAWITYLRSFA